MTTRRTATRRTVLKGLALAAPAVALPGLVPALFAADAPPAAAGGGKSLLILGGTAFLGPQLVEVARRPGLDRHPLQPRQDQPRALSRPREAARRPRRRATPEGARGTLLGRRRRHVGLRAAARRAHRPASSRTGPGQYVFVSTISVYSDNSKPGVDETAAVGTTAGPGGREGDGRDLRAAQGALRAGRREGDAREDDGRSAPASSSARATRRDRFTYWPVRVARGGEVLAPGTPADPVQLIDVRDLAEWTICAGSRSGRPASTTPPARRRRSDGERCWRACKAASGSDATFTWADGSVPRGAEGRAVGRHAGLGPADRRDGGLRAASAAPAPSPRG